MLGLQDVGTALHELGRQARRNLRQQVGAAEGPRRGQVRGEGGAEQQSQRIFGLRALPFISEHVDSCRLQLTLRGTQIQFRDSTRIEHGLIEVVRVLHHGQGLFGETELLLRRAQFEVLGGDLGDQRDSGAAPSLFRRQVLLQRLAGEAANAPKQIQLIRGQSDAQVLLIGGQTARVLSGEAARGVDAWQRI